MRRPSACAIFFSAIPTELALLAYVEQFAANNDPAKRTMYRVRGGNDRLVERIAGALRAPVLLRHIARRIVQKKHSVQLTVENSRGRRSTLDADYCIVTVPAPLASAIEYAPPLPERQRDALTRLRYGRATKTLLQFDRHPWRRIGTPARLRHRSRDRCGMGRQRRSARSSRHLDLARWRQRQ